MLARTAFQPALQRVGAAHSAVAFHEQSGRTMMHARHFLSAAVVPHRAREDFHSYHTHNKCASTTAFGQRNFSWVPPSRRDFSPTYEEPKDPLNSNKWKEYTSEDIEKALTDPSKSDIILIDVREPHEVEASGIIPTAYCLPANTQLNALFLDPEEFRERYGFEKPGIEDEDSEKDLVFYCKSGMRARNAARAAALAGYDEGKIGVYSGSWLDWSAKGGKSSKWERMQR